MKAKIAALALLTGCAFLPTAVFASVKHTASCSNGNFKGEIKYMKERDSNLRPWIRLTDYKITRSNGQQGGNKANFKIYPYVTRTYPDNRPSWSSADNNKQDGQWHVTFGEVKADQWEYLEHYHAKVKIVFDKKGNDPSCDITIN